MSETTETEIETKLRAAMESLAADMDRTIAREWAKGLYRRSLVERAFSWPWRPWQVLGWHWPPADPPSPSS